MEIIISLGIILLVLVLLLGVFGVFVLFTRKITQPIPKPDEIWINDTTFETIKITSVSPVSVCYTDENGFNRTISTSDLYSLFSPFNS